jgi:hypothetical protein
MHFYHANQTEEFYILRKRPLLPATATSNKKCPTSASSMGLVPPFSVSLAGVGRCGNSIYAWSF